MIIRYRRRRSTQGPGDGSYVRVTAEGTEVTDVETERVAAFTLYVDQAQSQNLFIEQAKSTDLHIDQARSFNLER